MENDSMFPRALLSLLFLVISATASHGREEPLEEKAKTILGKCETLMKGTPTKREWTEHQVEIEKDIARLTPAEKKRVFELIQQEGIKDGKDSKGRLAGMEGGVELSTQILLGQTEGKTKEEKDLILFIVSKNPPRNVGGLTLGAYLLHQEIGKGKIEAILATTTDEHVKYWLTAAVTSL